MNLLALFDAESRVQAFLYFDQGVIRPEFLSDSNHADVQDFLKTLVEHDPEIIVEKEGKAWFEKIPKEDSRYIWAVMSTMKIKGFDPYPIEEYQKKLLLSLNAKEYDPIRKGTLGDLLGIPEVDLEDFLKDLNEGIRINRGLTG